MQAFNHYPMKIRVPGKDLPDDYLFQLVEDEVMRIDDYHRIEEMGIDAFYSEDYLRRIGDLDQEAAAMEIMAFMTMVSRCLSEFDKRDIQPLVLASDLHPFFRLSLSLRL